MGDAAHGLHPIHAQGFNLAVRDVAALAEVVVEGVRAGADPGGPDALLRYDRMRRTDAWLTVGLTDGLNRLFSTDLAAARLVRGLGFAAIDRLPPLKQLAMRRGMGLEGDLPRLAAARAVGRVSADPRPPPARCSAPPPPPRSPAGRCRG